MAKRKKDVDADNLPRGPRSAGTRSGGRQLRRIDQVMELVGVALLPIGLAAIFLGWWGTAHNGYLFLQLPYLVSGGLLGVGLLTLAGFVYFASWISRTSAVQREQNAELLEAVKALQTQLALRPVDGGSAASNGTSERFLATPRGSMFHRPDCAIVTGRDDVREVTGDEEGMRPCGMCDPLASMHGTAPSN